MKLLEPVENDTLYTNVYSVLEKIEASECTDESEEDVEPTGNPV